MELVFTSSETAAITIFCSFPGVTRRAIKYDNKQSDSSSAANARCRAGEGMGTHSRVSSLCPGHGGSLPRSPGDTALPCMEPNPGGSAGTALPGRRPQSRETWLLSALPGTASSPGGQLQRWRYPSAGVSTRRANTWVAPALTPHGAGPRGIGPEDGSKPGTRLPELLLQPLHGTPWQDPLRAAWGPAGPKPPPSPSTARHCTLPTAIGLRRWVGWGPVGNDPKTTGDPESLPAGAPQVGGRGASGIGGH